MPIEREDQKAYKHRQCRCNVCTIFKVTSATFYGEVGEDDQTLSGPPNEIDVFGERYFRQRYEEFVGRYPYPGPVLKAEFGADGSVTVREYRAD